MSTVFENVSTPANEYAEIARRPLEADRCALLVVDIQEKLLPPIFHREQLVRNAKLLIRMGSVLKIPAIVSTQYAKGLGGTVPEVASLLPETEAIDKNLFSCFGSDAFLHAAQEAPGKPQHVTFMRHGKPYLRDADRAGGAAGGLSGACRIRRGEFANRMELENWSRPDARGGRGDFVD